MTIHSKNAMIITQYTLYLSYKLKRDKYIVLSWPISLIIGDKLNLI